jgi:hypothetical protein
VQGARRPSEIRFAVTYVTRLNVSQIQQVKNFTGQAWRRAKGIRCRAPQWNRLRIPQSKQGIGCKAQDARCKAQCVGHKV